jgi:hypothetical protein
MYVSVFKKLGLSDIQIRSWFNGPALLTWSRGQNEYGSNVRSPVKPTSNAKLDIHV